MPIRQTINGIKVTGLPARRPSEPVASHVSRIDQVVAADVAATSVTTSAKLAQLSALVDRLQFASTVGLTFNGERDLYTQLGYEPTLTMRHYRQRYRRGGVAARIVQAFPKATWSADARITEDVNNSKDTPFEAAISEIFDQLSVWSRFTRADVLANIGRYSIILIGTNNDQLKTPLPSKVSKLTFFSPVAEDNAPIAEYEDDLTSPRFGLPRLYRVNLGNIDTSFNGKPFVGDSSPNPKTADIHWSRVLHVADGLLEDDVFGEPRLRAIWNYLDDLDKVVGGGSEAAWKRMDPGMQLDVDPEIEMSPSEEERLEGEVDEYLHGLRRVIRTRGGKVNLLSTTVAGFGPNSSAIVELIASTTGIPQRILAGSERGQLASTQDDGNWWDRVDERRRSFAIPIIRTFVNRLIEHGVVPAPKTSRARVVGTGKDYIYTITWPQIGPLESPTTAEVLNKLAAANQSSTNAGAGLILTNDEIRHHVLGLGPVPKDGRQDALNKAKEKLLKISKPSPSEAPPGAQSNPNAPPKSSTSKQNNNLKSESV